MFAATTQQRPTLDKHTAEKTMKSWDGFITSDSVNRVTLQQAVVPKRRP